MSHSAPPFPPSSRPSSRSSSQVELLKQPDLVAFVRSAPIVLLLIGNSTGRSSCLVPVAHHFARRYPGRVRAGCVALPEPAQRVWALGLVRAALASKDQSPPPGAARSGAYLFLQGEALGFHEGPYGPGFEPVLRRIEELGLGSRSSVSVGGDADKIEAQRRLGELVRTAAVQVTDHFEGLLAALRSTRRRTPQEVLGLGRRPTQEEVKAAYRRLIRDHHPDLAVDPAARQAAHERSQEIIQAYRTLSRAAGRR